MATNERYPWHYYSHPRPTGINLRPQQSLPLIPYHTPSPHTPATSPPKEKSSDPKSVEIDFGTFLDAFNPLKVPKRTRSSSTSSDSTEEIPRSHAPAYYYWHPAPGGPTNFPYFAAPEPHSPPPNTSTRFKARPHVDGHNHTSSSEDEPTPRKKDTKKKHKETVIVLHHYCAQCGRPRSRRYQRENPVKKGVIPIPKICSRCMPPPESEDSNIEEEPPVRGPTKPDPKEPRLRGNKEVEEVFIRTGRGRPRFLNLQPEATETVRVTRRRTSSSPHEPPVKRRDSSGSSEHFQRIKVVREGGIDDRRVYRYRLVDEAPPRSEKAGPANKPPPKEESDEEPEPPKEPSPPREVRKIYRYRLVERPKGDASEPPSQLPRTVNIPTTTKVKELTPPRELSPLRMRVRYRRRSDSRSDEVSGNQGGPSKLSQQPNPAPPQSRQPKDAYRIVMVEREASPEPRPQQPESGSKPREHSPPEWYYRHYRRYNVPVDVSALVNQTSDAPLDPRSQRYTSPQRQSPSPTSVQRRPVRGILREDYPMEKDRYLQYRRQESESSDDDVPGSRVKFAEGTKRAQSAWPRDRTIQRQKEEVKDWAEATRDQHKLQRAKAIVRHRADRGGGAFELDGNCSEDAKTEKGKREREREVEKAFSWDEVWKIA